MNALVTIITKGMLLVVVLIAALYATSKASSFLKKNYGSKSLWPAAIAICFSCDLLILSAFLSQGGDATLMMISFLASGGLFIFGLVRDIKCYHRHAIIAVAVQLFLAVVQGYLLIRIIGAVLAAQAASQRMRAIKFIINLIKFIFG